MTILVTGVAGFIGSHLASKMLSQNFNVLGIDNLNDYYSVNLKKYRLKQLNKFKNFTFIRADLSKSINLEKVIKNKTLSVVCHLAAQAGVRYSITNPNIYLKYNIDGFLNILEYCRKYNTNLVYASSSSVYGANKKLPFVEIFILTRTCPSILLFKAIFGYLILEFIATKIKFPHSLRD